MGEGLAAGKGPEGSKAHHSLVEEGLGSFIQAANQVVCQIFRRAEKLGKILRNITEQNEHIEKWTKEKTGYEQRKHNH